MERWYNGRSNKFTWLLATTKNGIIFFNWLLTFLFCFVLLCFVCFVLFFFVFIVGFLFGDVSNIFLKFYFYPNEIRSTFHMFPDFFVQAFKIVVDSWKFITLLFYILWDGRPIFTISGSNQQLQQQLEYILLKPDCHSWWISKMQSGREDTLEERYAIKFSFKLGKMPQKRMEYIRVLLGHLTWIEHQFFSGIRDSMKAGSLWGMMRGVPGVRKSIQQSWLVKGLGLGLLHWGFKGVQQEIPSEEVSTLQIDSVAFRPWQCTSPQLQHCHRLFKQGGHQDSSSASL